eukprot:835552-Prymnesium_polylepis.2
MARRDAARITSRACMPFYKGVVGGHHLGNVEVLLRGRNGKSFLQACPVKAKVADALVHGSEAGAEGAQRLVDHALHLLDGPQGTGQQPGRVSHASRPRCTPLQFVRVEAGEAARSGAVDHAVVSGVVVVVCGVRSHGSPPGGDPAAGLRY